MIDEKELSHVISVKIGFCKIHFLDVFNCSQFFRYIPLSELNPQKLWGKKQRKYRKHFEVLFCLLYQDFKWWPKRAALLACYVAEGVWVSGGGRLYISKCVCISKFFSDPPFVPLLPLWWAVWIFLSHKNVQVLEIVRVLQKEYLCGWNKKRLEKKEKNVQRNS